MTSCPETSGNRPQRFLEGFRQVDKITGNSSPLVDLTVYSSKRAGITSNGNLRGKFTEVSGGFRKFQDIDGPHSVFKICIFPNLV